MFCKIFNQERRKINRRISSKLDEEVVENQNVF